MRLRDFPAGPVAKTLNAGGLGLIPGQGTRSHTLPLRIHMPQLRSRAAKYINKQIFLEKKK